MYTESQIVTIFKECKNIHEIMRAAYLLRELVNEGLQNNIQFIQSRALIRINHITDDGN